MASRRARLRVLAAFALIAAVGAGCNLITGAHDRVVGLVEDDDSGPSGADGGSDAKSDRDTPKDSGADQEAGPFRYVVPHKWMTPNGAKWMVTDAGTTITGFTGTFGHAILYPDPQPAIPSEAYTVEAVFRAPTGGEFGVITRVNNIAIGSLGSQIGASKRPFAAYMTTSDWTPTLAAGAFAQAATALPFNATSQFHFKVSVVGKQISAKVWETPSQSEPAQSNVSGTLTDSNNTGRGVGLYIYQPTFDAVLESMVVTAEPPF
jgi:hypothetical protein